MSSSKINESDNSIGCRKASINILEFNIYNWPNECWDSERNLGWLKMSKYAESLGIVKAPGHLNLREIRKIINKRFDSLRKYYFLKNVGRNFTAIQREQEGEFRLKHFVNKSMFSNELFILQATGHLKPLEYRKQIEDGLCFTSRNYTSTKFVGSPRHLRTPVRVIQENSSSFQKRQDTPIKNITREYPPLKGRSKKRLSSPDNNTLTQINGLETDESSSEEQTGFAQSKRANRGVHYSRDIKGESNSKNKKTQIDFDDLRINDPYFGAMKKDETLKRQQRKNKRSNKEFDSLKFRQSTGDLEGGNFVNLKHWGYSGEDENEENQEESDEDRKRQKESEEEGRTQSDSEDTENYDKLKDLRKSYKNVRSLRNTTSQNKVEGQRNLTNFNKSVRNEPLYDDSQTSNEYGEITKSNPRVIMEKKLESLLEDNSVNSKKNKLLKDLLSCLKQGVTPSDELLVALNRMGIADLYKYRQVKDGETHWQKMYEKECEETKNLKYYIRRLNDQFVSKNYSKKFNQKRTNFNSHPPSDKMNYLISIRILKDEIEELKRRIRGVSVSVKEEQIKKKEVENLVPHYRLDRNNLNAELVGLRKRCQRAQMKSAFNKCELEPSIN